MKAPRGYIKQINLIESEEESDQYRGSKEIKINSSESGPWSLLTYLCGVLKIKTKNDVSPFAQQISVPTRPNPIQTGKKVTFSKRLEVYRYFTTETDKDSLSPGSPVCDRLWEFYKNVEGTGKAVNADESENSLQNKSKDTIPISTTSSIWNMFWDDLEVEDLTYKISKQESTRSRKKKSVWVGLERVNIVTQILLPRLLRATYPKELYSILDETQRSRMINFTLKGIPSAEDMKVYNSSKISTNN